MDIASACLAGVNCRYDGKSSENKEVLGLVTAGKVMAVCPEVLGGLCIPREKSEMAAELDGHKKIVTEKGNDVTKEFYLGAQKTLQIAKIIGAEKAYLKSKSPSCGAERIYDGTFSGQLIKGHGVTADLLEKHGIQVIICDSD